jgi:carbonic anhydrase
VLDTWLMPLKQLKQRNLKELEAIEDPGKRAIRLAEINVAAGVETLLSNHVVEEAVKDKGLQVHGCIYDLATGRLRDLGVGHSRPLLDNGVIPAETQAEGVTVR